MVPHCCFCTAPAPGSRDGGISGATSALSQHFRCLMLEFPGFGVSDDSAGTR